LSGTGGVATNGSVGAKPLQSAPGPAGLGHNDVASDVFTQDDARTLAEFARQKKLGLLSFWAINRDQPGSGDLGLYSGVNHSTFEFHHIFETVRQ
jgi:hypothetical protein